jgi:hypothetical protein
MNQELGQLTILDTLMLNRNFLNGTLPDSFSALVEMGKKMSLDTFLNFALLN